MNSGTNVSNSRNELHAAEVPSIGFCSQKNDLLRGFMEAIREVTAAQNAQLIAVINGDQDFCEYEDLIYAAREKKDLVKYAYLAHVQEHGCYDGVEAESVVPKVLVPSRALQSGTPAFGD